MHLRRICTRETSCYKVYFLFAFLFGEESSPRWLELEWFVVKQKLKSEFDVVGANWLTRTNQVKQAAFIQTWF